MARLSRQTRETIKIIVVLLVAAILIFLYIIYPLNRSKVMLGREGLDTYVATPLPPNDPTAFREAGLKADTFRGRDRWPDQNRLRTHRPARQHEGCSRFRLGGAVGAPGSTLVDTIDSGPG